MKKGLLLLLLLLSFNIFSHGQAVGDYGSNGAVNLNSSSNWIVCATAGTWTGATAAPSAPTTSINVWIRTGHILSTASGAANNCKDLTVAGGTITPSGGNPRYITCSGAFNMTSGTINLNSSSNSYYIAGATSISISGGTIDFTNGSGTPASYIESSGNISITGTPTFTYSGTGVAERGFRYTGSGTSATIASSVAIGSINVSGSGTITTSGSFTVSRGVRVTNATGIFKIASGHTVTSTTGAGANATTVSVSGGKISIDGTLDNQSTTAMSLTGATAVTVNSGGTYVHNTTAAFGNNFTLSTGSNFIYRGSSTLNTLVNVSGVTYHNLSFESTSGAWVPTLSGSGALTINGSLSIGASGAGTISTGTGYTGDATIAGGVTIGTGSTLAFAGSYNVGGNWSNSGTFTHASAKTVTFNGTGSQSVTKTGGETFYNLTVAKASGTLTLGSNVAVNAGGAFTITTGTVDVSTFVISGGAFSLASGTTLITSNSSGVNSAGASGSIQTTTRTFNSGANFEFKGANTGVFTTSSDPQVNNFTVNRSAGVTLDKSYTVNNVLGFTSGLLTLGSNSITIGTSGSITGSGVSAYIATTGTGALTMRVPNTNTNITFPIGTSSRYNPIILNNNGGTADNYSIKVVSGAPSNTPNSTTAYVQNTWTITEAVATGSNLAITTQWNASSLNTQDEGSTFSHTTASVGLYNGTGTSWTTNSATIAGSNPYTAQASAFTQDISGGVACITGNFIVATPDIDVADNGTQIAAANVYNSGNSNIIYSFKTTVTTANATLSTVAITTSGNYTATDLTNLKLWYNSSNNFGTASAIKTITPAGATTETFSSLSQLITSSTIGYFWITADIASSGITAGHTIAVAAITTGNLTFVSGNKSATVPPTAGGTQTIISTPSVTSNAATAIATTSIKLNGDVNANAGSAVASFDYGTTAGYGTNVTADESPVTGTNSTSISKTVSGLTANTLYHFRAKGVNTAGTINGSDVTVTTLSNAPAMDNTTARTPSATGFTANWTVPASQGPETFTYTIEVNDDNTFADAAEFSQSAISSGSFVANVTGLISGNTYYYRVKAVNAGGSSAWSATSTSVTTTSATAPSITTGAVTASSILTDGAEVAGNNVTSDGGNTITARGLIYNTSSPAQTGGTAVALGSGTTGTFNQTLSSLAANTEYFVKAYATNGIGTTYAANEVSFTTLATEPTSASTVSFGTKSNTSLVINFTGGNGTRRFVVVRPTNNSFGFTPTDRVTLTGTISSVFTTATDQGGGDRIVYDNTGTTVTVTGLTANTIYYVHVYEYTNNSAGSPNYFATPSTAQNTSTYNPTITVTGTLSAFGNRVTGTSSSSQSYTVNGTELASSITITAPAGFSISLDDADFSVNPIILARNGSDAVTTTTIYTRFSPSSATGATGSLNITHTATDATTKNVGVSGNAIATEPTTNGTISFGTVTSTSIVVNLPTVGNGNNRIIVVKAGSAVSFAPTDGAAIGGTISAVFGTATDQGSGNKVVYQGTGSGASLVTITGLSSNTTYHFAVYEYNQGSGTSYNYYTSAFVTGSQATSDVSNQADAFRSAITGNWNSAGTWESFTNGAWITATLTPDNTSSTITIQSGHTVTVTASVSADEMTIASGGQVTVNSGQTLTIANGAAATDLTVNGYLKNSGTLTMTGAGTVSGASATYEHNLNTGTIATLTWASNATLKITGTYSNSGSGVAINSGNYQNVWFEGTINSGDYFNLNAATIAGKLTIASTGSGAVLGSSTNSTTGLSVASFDQTGGNFYANRNAGSGTRTLTVSGNVNITGGVFDIKQGSGSSTGLLNIGGNLMVGASGTLTTSGSATAASIAFTSGSAQTWDNPGTFSSSSLGIGVNITGAGGVTLNDNITLPLTSSLTLTNGNFTVAAGKTLTLTGTATLAPANGRTITVNGTLVNSAIQTTPTTGAMVLSSTGSYVHNTTSSSDNIWGITTFNAGSTWVYRGSSVLNSFIGISSKTFANLTFESTSGVWSPAPTGTGTLTVNGNLSVGGAGAGTFNSGTAFTGNVAVTGGITIAAGSALAFAGDYTLAGNWANSGTFTNAASKEVTFNGTNAQSITGATTFTNLNISNTSAAVNAANDITVGGIFTTNTNSILDMGANALSVSTVSNSGTLKTQNTSSTPVSAAKTWGGVVEYNGTGAQTVVTGSYSNLTISGTRASTPIITLASGTVGVAGTFTDSHTGVVSYVTTGNTFDFNGTAAQSISAFNFNNLTISGNKNSGAVTLISGGTIGIAGTLSATATNTSYTTTNNTVNFNGSSTQSIGSAIGYNNLQNNNTSSTVSAGGNLIVSGSFTTASGSVTDMGTNTLTVATVSHSGTLKTQNTGTTPITTGKTWGGTVEYNSSSAQTVVAATSYNNLTVSNTGTKTMADNTTIAGTLSLPAAGDFLALDGHTLTLSGATSITGYLKGSSTSTLVLNTLAASSTVQFNAAAQDSLLYSLTLDRTGGGVTFNSNIGITGLLTITNGDFNLNGKTVTLKSSSIVNTALVSKVIGTITYGTGGAFVTERFVPKSRKAFRDLTTGVVTTQTVLESWQENGVNNNGYGTHVTGSAGSSGVNSTTGFDNTASGNVSIYSFNIGTGAGTWDAFLNTNATILSPYKGYRVSLRGNRAHNLGADVDTMTSEVVLRSKGILVTGNVTYATTGVTALGSTVTAVKLSGTSSGFTMIGNPYASPIDWESIAANTTDNNNIKTSYTIFDPNLATVGAYVTYNAGMGSSNAGSAVNRYIQPGQAFFVQNSGGADKLVIREDDKQAVQNGATLTAVFGSGDPVTLPGVRFNLYKTVNGKAVNMDGAVTRFSSTFNKAAAREDAQKVSNNSDNLGINVGTGQYSMEGRPEPGIADSISLRLTTVTTGVPYKLSIDLSEYNPASLTMVLNDNFLNTQTPLAKGIINEYSFTTTAAAASFNNRFAVKFRDASVLPVNFISVKAAAVTGGNLVEWNVTETDAAGYDVEYSIDGLSFSRAGVVKATGSGNYNYLHNTVTVGTVYYRIRAIDKAGNEKYSSIISVKNTAFTQAGLAIYPNPVKEATANIRFNAMPKDNYNITVFTSSGQMVYKGTISHTGIIASYPIHLPAAIASGVYRVRIEASAGSKYNLDMIVE